MPSIINSDDGVVSGTSGLKTTGGNDGLLNIQSNGSTVVAVTGSGISVTGTVSQTGVSTFAAGTVSAPSITFTGDTNTGIYSPGADQVSITTGGTQRVAVDSSGNVGIGVTPSAWNAGKALEISAVGNSIWGNGAANFRLFSNAYYNGGFKYANTAAATQYSQDAGVHAWSSAASGTAGNAITFTQVLAVEKAKTLALEGATSQTGTGITFPATQSASTNANTLDDYEEGTWTGTLQGVTTNPTTPVTATGTYIKIGKLVYVAIRFQDFSNVGASGDVFVSGLPFTEAEPIAAMGICGAYLFDFTAGRTSITLQISSARMYPYVSGDDVGWAGLKHTAGTGRYLELSATYFV